MAVILKAKKAVILKLRNPAKVTTVIPTAKLVTSKGQELVAVPHRPDETRVLRSLGFDIPDPILHHYEWPRARGLYEPFSTQLSTAAIMTMNTRGFVNNAMGTGKTLSTLYAYDYLRQCKQAKKLLVICPLSTMERTWADEVFRTFPHLQANVLYGSAERRKKLLADLGADIYIINTDGIQIIAPLLAKRPDIDTVVIDEIAMFRNYDTRRFRIMNTILNKQPIQRRAWGLTGMPTPNAPTDAWAQCRLVTPGNTAVPKYFGAARDLVMDKVATFKYLAKASANATVLEWLQPSIRYTLDEVVELPDEVILERHAEMSDQQKAAYQMMISKLKTEYEGGQILAVNEANKASKLVQIACGVAYAQDGNRVILPAPNRIALAKELIEESEGKVIVFVPLTGALEHVAAELAKDWPVGVVHGATPKAERDSIFQGFQDGTEPHVLVANPGTMSHGLTLTRATTIIWFAPIYSLDIYGQANARIRRPGQTQKTRIVQISGSTIEERIYAKLVRKESTQSILLDLLEDQ
jgi:SNF2 family DNA or RNA helicase